MNTHEDSKYIPPYPFPSVNRWDVKIEDTTD